MQFLISLQDLANYKQTLPHHFYRSFGASRHHRWLDVDPILPWSIILSVACSPTFVSLLHSSWASSPATPNQHAPQCPVDLFLIGCLGNQVIKVSELSLHFVKSYNYFGLCWSHSADCSKSYLRDCDLNYQFTPIPSGYYVKLSKMSFVVCNIQQLTLLIPY